MGRAVVLVWLVACSFQAGTVPATSDGAGGSDARDARLPDARPDAALDAKQLVDGAPSSAALTVTPTTYGSMSLDVNLTTEGTLDWVHWGYSATSSSSPTGFDRDMSVTPQISNLAMPASLSFSGAPLTSSWANGTPHVMVSMTSTGVGDHQGGTLQFTVPAGIIPHTLRLYCGAQLSTERLDVSLSDNSAPAVSASFDASSGTSNVKYTIVFAAASNGQTLTLKWTDTNDQNGGMAFSALLSATLALQ